MMKAHRPAIMRDRRISKVENLCNTIKSNMEYARAQSDPKEVRKTIRVARSWESDLRRVLYELEWYAAKAAGEETPKE